MLLNFGVYHEIFNLAIVFMFRQELAPSLAREYLSKMKHFRIDSVT
jgi:hypothetical protein